MVKPATVMFNKVTIKGAKQAVQMFGPAQRGVAMAVADCVEDGTIPADEARWMLSSCSVSRSTGRPRTTPRYRTTSYEATKLSIKRAVKGEPTAAEVVSKKASAEHPFAAHS